MVFDYDKSSIKLNRSMFVTCCHDSTLGVYRTVSTDDVPNIYLSNLL